MNERISALMDGELGDREAGHAIADLETTAEARETWRTYHLISDAMRDARVLSPGFADRVAQRLAQEPTVLAPRRLKPESAPRIALPAAAAASVAGVALVGWLAFAPRQDAVVAQAPAKPPAAAAQVATVPLPSGTPDYLFAHQGFSPRVSLQGMAPYARTVSSQANEGRR
ncbi:MAG TPA: sigma-E factor negative regulatory protein [Burkholderiales bacterium]|nr:sigma-E factor negative regulatory protein [Burkholderiales bacterium]